MGVDRRSFSRALGPLYDFVDAMNLSPGTIRYVLGGNTSNTIDGKTHAKGYATMAAALAVAADNDVIGFTGNIREQLVAPLGVTGVKIVGIPGGRTRHDDGARWYDPAVPVAGKALIEIREQGWEFHNFLMVPNATGSCIKAHREENATYPDSSHFICRGMRLTGTEVATQVGIEDYGGNHHYLVEDCEFQHLGTAIKSTNVSIAVPLRNMIRNSWFGGNVNDIVTPLSASTIKGNQFMTPGAGATNKVIDLAGGVGDNHVIDNWFNNTEAQIAPGSGYRGVSGDIWKNHVNDAADMAIGLPA